MVRTAKLKCAKFNLNVNFFTRGTRLARPFWAVTKTRNGRNGTGRNGKLRNFPVINKKFRFTVRVPKSKFKGLGRATVWLQDTESGKKRDGIVLSVPFNSGF